MLNKIYLIFFLALFLNLNCFVPQPVFDCFHRVLNLTDIIAGWDPCVEEDWFAPREFRCTRDSCNPSRLETAIINSDFNLFLDLWRSNVGCRRAVTRLLNNPRFSRCANMSLGSR